MYTCGRLEFAGDKVVLADDLRIVDDVELLSGRQLLAADAADEAFEMVDGLACAPYQIVRRDPLSAAAALGAEPSADASSHRTVYSARTSLFYSTIAVGSTTAASSNLPLPSICISFILSLNSSTPTSPKLPV